MRKLFQTVMFHRPGIIKTHFLSVLNLRHHLPILFLFLPRIPGFRHADFVHQAKFHCSLLSAVARDWSDVTLSLTVWSRNARPVPRDLSLDSTCVGHLRTK